MKREIVLGIAATSLLCADAYAAPAATPAPAAAPASHGGGKCASGKCGTEKIYGQTRLQHNPDGQLVRARDGKCGLTGKGYNVVATERDRLAEGVCGR
ncbi:hypothetical protein [Novosphingobium sp. FSW06-99]|uniref:hypothetical protein n=1 Tax=Novosphingobium sp. FSW06-99 TaxID=1739113 RepID=UPI00076C74EE|nr:hypothetical protein [Novosphingobium sp. FSW06-99]KUR79052.1 hypothetical protein AQZ49_06465 [Novosphingobium sp. FSW06-99]